MEPFGFEFLGYLSDVRSPTGTYTNGTLNGMVFDELFVAKVGLGGQAFHDYVRGKHLYERYHSLLAVTRNEETYRAYNTFSKLRQVWRVSVD